MVSISLSASTLSVLSRKFSSIWMSYDFHALHYLRIISSEFWASGINLLLVASSEGGESKMLYSTPVYGSTLTFVLWRTQVSSSQLKTMTRLGLILRAFRRLIYDREYGNPSMIQPLTLQSLCFIRFSIKGLIMLSGTSSPVSRHWEIILPTSGLLLISFLSKARADMCTNPNYAANAFDWVWRPDPGGPTRRMRGGLLGAFSLNLRLSILIKYVLESL